jgi:hypothetical protein
MKKQEANYRYEFYLIIFKYLRNVYYCYFYYRRKLRKAVEQNNELIRQIDVKLVQNISTGHKINDQYSDTTD